MTCSRDYGGDGRYGRQAATVLVLSVAAWVAWPGAKADELTAADSYAPAADELEVKSEFSQIIVRTRGNLRSLIFVDDDGTENLESKVDLHEPHRLLLPYSRSMFASYLFRPRQRHVLIVGLGGGAMVHFLKHHHPDLRVDVVEIDPVVVKIAAEYFAVRSGGNLKIIRDDAVDYLENTKQRYGVIYMDAFLGQSAETDATGVPRRLKTIEFLKSLQRKLEPDGLAVFNVHSHSGAEDYVNAVRSVFPQVYVFDVPRRLSFVVVGSLQPGRLKAAELRSRARQLDDRFEVDFSFRRMVKDLKQ